MGQDGLIIMRAQPFHIGHKRLVEMALYDQIYTQGKIFIVLGSTQEFGTSRNPFTFSERKKMIKNYCTAQNMWDRITIHGLKDINDASRWADYVITEIETNYLDTNLARLYCGSEYDFSWFRNTKLQPKILNRVDQGFPYVSASMLREMLIYGDLRWRKYIPECNWQIVAKKFNRLDMLEPDFCEKSFLK